MPQASENIGLLKSQQRAGFANLIAKQANTRMVLPLAPFPGVPNILEMKHPGRIPEVGPVTGLLPVPPRINVRQQPTNLAVPGFTLAEALAFRPDPDAPVGPLQWGNFVLGFPNPFETGNPGGTMIEQAVALKPTTTLIWIGNNDALIGAMVGNLTLMTPLSNFETSYKEILDKLSATNSTLITVNIPDVTNIPFFTPATEVASLFGIDLRDLRTRVGIGPRDYVRRSALPIIDDILSGKLAGPLPEMCPSPIYALPVEQVPCALTAQDAAIVQARVNAYNDAIRRQSDLHDAVLMDAYGLVQDLSRKGYKLKHARLSTAYLGGLFSLDGIHPSNTGYAVMANFMIDELNHAFKLRIPEVSVQDVWDSDPLSQYATVSVNGNH